MQPTDFLKVRFPFSLEKGVAMLQYLLNGVGGEYNYMALLKLAFFADRFHVRAHARPVSMDDYFAFPYGTCRIDVEGYCSGTRCHIL